MELPSKGKQIRNKKTVLRCFVVSLSTCIVIQKIEHSYNLYLLAPQNVFIARKKNVGILMNFYNESNVSNCVCVCVCARAIMHVFFTLHYIG